MKNNEARENIEVISSNEYGDYVLRYNSQLSQNTLDVILGQIQKIESGEIENILIVCNDYPAKTKITWDCNKKRVCETILTGNRRIDLRDCTCEDVKCMLSEILSNYEYVPEIWA